MQRLAQNGVLQRLERSDCIQAYARELVLDRRNLLMVMKSSAIQPSHHNHASSLLALYASTFTSNATLASSTDLPS